MKLRDTVVEDLLFGGRAGRRQLSESAVQAEVWKTFAESSAPVDLLLTPLEGLSAPELARRLLERIRGGERKGNFDLIALEGIAAIKTDLDTFLCYILPATGLDLAVLLGQLPTLTSHEPKAVRRQNVLTLGQMAELIVEQAGALSPDLGFGAGHLSPELRIAMLAALLMMRGPKGLDYLDDGDLQLAATGEGYAEHRIDVAWSQSLPPAKREIWQVSMNRPVKSMAGSIETVKADAARRLFDLSCRDITWAVIDAGIDGSHPAFRDHDKGGFAIRIDAAYDFSSLRRYAAIDAPDNDPAIIEEIMSKAGLSHDDASAFLADLREDAKRGRPFDWEVLAKILRREPDKLDPPPGIDRPIAHGTHVAGVLAGDWRENDSTIFQGVCPDLRLYDLRVLGTNEDTEIAVIAALEFVRWLNGRNRYLTIHGVNMSLGLKHDVKNFACGQTPVCKAADATVRSGVVVVAAAGNSGRQTFVTADGAYEGYSAVSIFDPGNTDSVITVGSTHRERPHEYGVSFFSSRGPTGDGRAKPDLVAPGERIDGPLPNAGMGRLDGTSMSAPHVSGVAALLLARNAEFIGNPMRVKRTLVSTATDLGRERHFQGAGLVDALRALQSV